MHIPTIFRTLVSNIADSIARLRLRIQFLLAFLLIASAPVYAQQTVTQDVATIDGIITAYYEAVSGPEGESADAERDRRLHHPDAWVAIAGKDSEGKPQVNVMSLDDYHGENKPRSQAFWEWETAREIKRSGNMVHVWSSYASSLTPQGESFTTGVNSITLFNDGQRWWIMGWMFDSSAAPVN